MREFCVVLRLVTRDILCDVALFSDGVTERFMHMSSRRIFNTISLDFLTRLVSFGESNHKLYLIQGTNRGQSFDTWVMWG